MDIKIGDKVRIKNSEWDAKFAYVMKIDTQGEEPDYLISRKEPMLLGRFNEDQIEKVS